MRKVLTKVALLHSHSLLLLFSALLRDTRSEKARPALCDSLIHSVATFAFEVKRACQTSDEKEKKRGKKKEEANTLFLRNAGGIISFADTAGTPLKMKNSLPRM